MTGKTGLAAVVLAAGVFAPGCVSCGCPAPPAGGPVACPEFSSAQRGRVHVVLVNGADPLDCGGLSGLRDELALAGFPTSYYGRPFHAGHFTQELRAVLADDPMARFVIVGYELGAPAALAIAGDLGRCGHPADAVVLLDPAGATAAACDGAGTAVHVVRSAGWSGGAGLPAGHSVAIGCGHFGVPTDCATVRHVVDLLRTSAGLIPQEVFTPAVLPLIDNPAPLPGVVPDPPAKSVKTAAANPWAKPIR